MANVLHITSGDCAGELLEKSGIGGTVLVWHDLLYEGIRPTGRPDAQALIKRAEFISNYTGGGLSMEDVLSALLCQYRDIERIKAHKIILWFDACLFDQSMLAHILCCLEDEIRDQVYLLCVSEFPGIKPFNGLGQLSPEQILSLEGKEVSVTPEQFAYAQEVEIAFASQDQKLLTQLAQDNNPALPFIPAAAARWLEETAPANGKYGKLKTLTLQTLADGVLSPIEIFKSVSNKDHSPQYWGDTTLWREINLLADEDCLTITGPADRLPQWGNPKNLGDYKVTSK